MEVLVRFEPSQRSVRVPGGTSLLEATRLASLPLASACAARGACGRCGLAILRGADELPAESDQERDLKQRNRIDPRLRLACRVRLAADVVVTAPYW